MSLLSMIAQSAVAAEYTDYTSAKGLDPHPNECAVMTLNNLMVKLQ